MQNVFKASLLMLGTTIAYAGTMGEDDTNKGFIPFINGEASANWVPYGGEQINNIKSTQVFKRMGGRLSVGVVKDYKEGFSFAAEAGYGYYGKVWFRFQNSANNGNFYIDGLDLLFGAQYTLNRIVPIKRNEYINKIDLYFKAGAMLQNRRITDSLNQDSAYSGNVIYGIEHKNYNLTQALPALKTGGVLHYRDNIAFTLSYMHVFGSTPSSIITKSITITAPTTATVIANSSLRSQNPSIDSFLFGIQYNFA